MKNEENRVFTLKALRALQNETQKDTAKAVGISPSAYSRFERNPGKIPMSLGNALSIHFNVRMDQIKFM